MAKRIRSVVRRTESILRALQEMGPMSVNQVALETGLLSTRARYALTTMVNDQQAHIHHYEDVADKEGHPRSTAFYAAGQGENAVPEEKHIMDFESTAHLQPIYIAWAKTRTPDPLPEGIE